MKNNIDQKTRCPFGGIAKSTIEKQLTSAEISPEDQKNINNIEYWYQKGLHANSEFEKIDPITGFIPSNPPLTKLPEAYKEWDIMASKLPQLMRTNSVQEYLKQMPCLSAIDLPEEFIYRASVIIGSASHAYSYSENAYCQQTFHLTPSSLITEDRTFPASIERPYQELTKRLKRASPQALIYEFSIYNWKFKSRSKTQFNFSDLNTCLDNLELLVPIFDVEAERRFILNFFMTELLAGPCPGLIVEISRCIKTNDQNKLCSVLLEICDHLEKCNLMLKHNIPLNENHHNYFNSPLWTKTVAPLWAGARHGEVGISGGASPFFIMFDNLISREKYEGNLGHQMMSKENDNPLSFTHRHFLNSIRYINLQAYIAKSKNPRLQNVFFELCRLYNGDQGYHAIHRNIVMGYMLVGTACGRGNTNSGTLQWHDNNAVLELDDEFDGAKHERDLGIDANKKTLKCELKESQKIGNSAKELVFNVKNKVFKVHPGDKVAVIPKNDLLKVDFIVKNIDVRNFQLNKHWKTFFYQNNIDLKGYSPKSVVKKIIEYADLSCIDFLSKQGFDIEKNINILKPLPARFYTISSSQDDLDKNAELKLTVGLLEYENQNQNNFGLCSKYLFHLEEKEMINFSLIRSNWNIPSNKRKSVIMIAGGTGISLMMSWLRNQHFLKNNDNTLFFVTKDSNNFYYRNDLSQIVEQGDLSFYGSYTRAYSNKVGDLISKKSNIRHLLMENKQYIINQVKNGAYFFVCGRVSFGQTVRDTIREITQFSEQQMNSMIVNGKYKEELFTTYQKAGLTLIDEIDVIINPDYFIIDNSIYDISAYKYQHPGGAELFLSATEVEYKRQHGNCPSVDNILKSLYVGSVKPRNIKNLDLYKQEFFNKLKNVLEVSCNSMKKFKATTGINVKDTNTIILYELAYMTLDVYLKPIILNVINMDKNTNHIRESNLSLEESLNYLNIDKENYDNYLEGIKNLAEENIDDTWFTLKESGNDLLISIRDITLFHINDLNNKDEFVTEIKRKISSYFSSLHQIKLENLLIT